jgi:hypothetical protein
LEKLNKIIKTLEEELANKAERIKALESKTKEINLENKSLMERLKDLQR